MASFAANAGTLKRQRWDEMGLFKRHECQKCGRKFRQEEELMHHHLIAHGSTIYDCKACNLNFSSMEEMRTHLQREHQYRRKDDA